MKKATPVEKSSPVEISSIVPVLVPVAVERPYSYLVPDHMSVGPGAIVRVPLGPRSVTGVVWDGPPDTGVDAAKLRSIETVFPVPPLAREHLAFIDWVAGYTIAAPGMVLRMVLRAPTALEPEPPLKGVRQTGPPPARLTAARSRVLELTGEGFAWTKSGLAGAAGVSPSVIDGLVQSGTLEPVDLPAGLPVADPDPDFARPRLTAAQESAIENLRANFAGGGYSVTLLDGVTGSGKTEVYFEAIAEVLREGAQILVLLPEIALTVQFLERFEQRFGARPAEWHSDLTPKQRERVWRGVITGAHRVVVGARSSLHLPFARLGLIVIDEEHDLAYKQEDRVTYSARDMGIVRAHLAGIPVILASATPSIESRVNADVGRFHRIQLLERATGAPLPDIEAIDMRTDGPARGDWLAPRLVEAVSGTLDRGQQALVFLNRRGYAPLTLCRSCGHRFKCSDCSAWLVEHRFRGTLNCHHCGDSQTRPQACPECGDLDSLTACGPGVERVAEEVARLFPDHRSIILSSDLLGGTKRLRRELAAIADGEFDVIIGTQIVAKGHNFPNLTLVGIVDADLGLANGDPRAAEKTFQLLAQVTGRAGRVFGGGRGLLQTYMPNHPVMLALADGDREAFYAREIEQRMQAGLPPFARLAAVVVSAPEKAAAQNYARLLAQAAPSEKEILLLGPSEAPLFLVRGRYRFRLLARAPRALDLQGYIRRWLGLAPSPRGGVRVAVDIDPQTFL